MSNVVNYRKILVIGGGGFIGVSLVSALSDAGCEVSVLDRRGPPACHANQQFKIHVGDICDVAVLRSALEGVDVVVHLASSVVPATSNLDPVADVENNLIGVIRLLEVMREMGTRRLIYFSSGGTVYGPPRVLPICEDHPESPISSYGIVKGASEKYIRMFGHLHGLRYCILRPSNPYGPGQLDRASQGVIAAYLWRLARREHIEIWGDGNVVRDFIYIDDLVSGSTRVIIDGVEGTYNVGAGAGQSINEIISVIARVTGLTPDVRYLSGRGVDVPQVVLYISKLCSVNSWRPSIAIEQGIAKTWRWILGELGR